jgi:hypothetical protein
MHRTWIGVMAAVAMVWLAPAAVTSEAVFRDPAAALRAIEDAVSRDDRAAAERLRGELYTEALASRRWSAWLLAGDAALAVGRGAPDPVRLRAAARRAYRAGLFQARGQGSVDGVLQTAEAFARLGDHEVVEGALRIAEQMPGERHTSEIERVRLAADRLRRLAQRDPMHRRIDP